MAIASLSNFRALIERQNRLHAGDPDKIQEIAGVDPRALPDERADVDAAAGAARPGGALADGARGARIRRRRPSAICAGSIATPRWARCSGAPDIGGRFFYNDDLSGFNFRPVQLKLDAVLEEIARHRATLRSRLRIYVGSTTVDTCLPGFRAENDLDFGDRQPLVSIWIGNRTRIAAHHDLPDNLACVVVGHRRFTLFPPEQLANLYVGPLDFTPAGQAISLVDFAQAGFRSKFPRFAEALKQRAGRRARARAMRIFIPEHVVAPHRVARQPQRAGELLVASVAGVHGFADERADARHHERARPAAGAARRPGRTCFVTTCSRRTTARPRTFPKAHAACSAPLDDAAARELRARLLQRLNR